MATNAKLLEKLKKNTTIKMTSTIDESILFTENETVTTTVPAVNIALSGSVNGGFGSGLFLWAGPSKHFKTNFTLLMMKAYLDKYPDSIALFYDSEFGANPKYFESFGIDVSRVVHTPVTNIEELKFDIMQQLDNIKRGDKVFIALDSAGNIASRKEVDDAIEGKSVSDMTRAKQLKSLFRMITPHLTLKQIPMVVVNHTYQTQEMFSKAVVSGGTGIYYSASAIFIIGRQQEKDGTELAGYNFIINVEKSRFTREKSKIPVQVTHAYGMNTYSGILDLALEAGEVMKPSNGWYSLVDKSTGEIDAKKVRAKDTESEEFLGVVLQRDSFKQWVKSKFELSGMQGLQDAQDESSSAE